MKTVKQKRLCDGLSKEDGHEVIKQFQRELDTLRQKYGVEAHLSVVEYFAKTDEGNRVPWTHTETKGDYFRILVMATHAYGSIRSDIDRQVDHIKERAYTRDAK